MSRSAEKGKLITAFDLMHNSDLLSEEWFCELSKCFSHYASYMPVLVHVKLYDVKVDVILPCWARRYSTVWCENIDGWGTKKFIKGIKKWVNKFNREHKGECYTTPEEVLKASVYVGAVMRSLEIQNKSDL